MSICKHLLRPRNRPLTIDNPSTRPYNGCSTNDNHRTQPCNRCLTSDNRPTRPCNGCSTSDNRPTQPCNGCLTNDNHPDPHWVKTRCSVWGLDTVWLEAQHAAPLPTMDNCPLSILPCPLSRRDKKSPAGFIGHGIHPTANETSRACRTARAEARTSSMMFNVYLLATQLSRTTKHSAVKDVKH